MDKDATSLMSAATMFADLAGEGQTADLPQSIQLLDQVDSAMMLDRLLNRAAADALELLPSQIEALRAVHSGAGSIDELTMALGLVDGMADLLLESLSDEGLALTRPDGMLSLTDAGAAMLDQAEGIRFRIADLASVKLSEDQSATVADILASVQDLSSERQLPRA